MRGRTSQTIRPQTRPLHSNTSTATRFASSHVPSGTSDEAERLWMTSKRKPEAIARSHNRIIDPTPIALRSSGPPARFSLKSCNSTSAGRPGDPRKPHSALCCSVPENSITHLRILRVAVATATGIGIGRAASDDGIGSNIG